MATTTVNVEQLRTRLSELLTLVSAGDEIVITENSKPLARLVPILAERKPRVAGLHKGAIWTSDDFDQPLPDEFWVGAK